MSSGRLPHVCVATGEATEDTMGFKFSTSPAWTLVFILIGLFPYVIAAAATAKRAAGRLPLVARKHPWERLRRWGGWIVTLVGILAIVAAGFVGSMGQDNSGQTASGVLVGLGLLLIPAGIVGVIVRGFVGVSARVEGVAGIADNWVTLSRVHPAFAEAVMRMYAERAAHAPQPVPDPYAQPYQVPAYAPRVATPPPADAPLPPPYVG